MEAPEGFSPAELRLWGESVAVLEGRAGFSESWAPAIERYVRSVELARTAWRKVPRTQKTTRGSMGQQVAHPMIAVAQKADAEAMRFGQALGLEPLPAARPVGRPRGAVSAPDRAAAASGEPAKITRLKAVK